MDSSSPQALRREAYLLYEYQVIDKLVGSGEQYALILMDVMIPIMDGYSATRAIRNLEDQKLASIPIITMTANAFEEDRQAALDAGMNDPLAKPFRIDKLYEMMKSICRDDSSADHIP